MDQESKSNALRNLSIRMHLSNSQPGPSCPGRFLTVPNKNAPLFLQATLWSDFLFFSYFIPAHSVTDLSQRLRSDYSYMGADPNHFGLFGEFILTGYFQWRAFGFLTTHCQIIFVCFCITSASKQSFFCGDRNITKLTTLTTSRFIWFSAALINSNVAISF